MLYKDRPRVWSSGRDFAGGDGELKLAVLCIRIGLEYGALEGTLLEVRETLSWQCAV